MKKYFLIIGLILLCGICQATINITANDTSYNYIKWNWNTGLTLTNMSIDGYQVILVDKSANSFILSELQENTTHTIKIMTSNDNGFNQSTTTKNPDNQNSVMGFIYQYIWWLIAVIILGIAFQTKSVMFAYISAISTIIGMVSGIQSNEFFIFLLYIITFISAYFVTEGLKGR